ncbi:MAG: glycosyltransferase [Phycisphaerales bacterium]|nr:glycosyltransferase [Phycisphaerales bacterium]
MDVSVVIPTHARPDRLAACVRALAAQTVGGDRFEVLVGIDGGEDDPRAAEAVRAALRAAWPHDRADRLGVVPLPRQGQAAVRNALLARARGETIVFLNDDVVPGPGLLAAHLAAQREARAAGRRALVVGSAPWRVHTPDRLFDRLIRETSMVFFYDRMDAMLRAGEAGRDHDWGFRHAWMLNLSAPAALVREAGGIAVFPDTYGYEDDELAWRLARRFGTRVLYRPEAVAVHDHRMDPEDYLRREFRLGHAAWGFARAAPECARDMFGRDVASGEEAAYSREFVRRERATAERLEASFRALADLPADAASGPHAGAIVRLAYEQHLLLKRWHWRRGLLAAADEHAPSHDARERT